jgi:hypothetical protein
MAEATAMIAAMVMRIRNWSAVLTVMGNLDSYGDFLGRERKYRAKPPASV